MFRFLFSFTVDSSAAFSSPPPAPASASFAAFYASASFFSSSSSHLLLSPPPLTSRVPVRRPRDEPARRARGRAVSPRASSRRRRVLAPDERRAIEARGDGARARRAPRHRRGHPDTRRDADDSHRLRGVHTGRRLFVTRVRGIQRGDRQSREGAFAGRARGARRRVRHGDARGLGEDRGLGATRRGTAVCGGRRNGRAHSCARRGRGTAWTRVDCRRSSRSRSFDFASGTRIARGAGAGAGAWGYGTSSWGRRAEEGDAHATRRLLRVSGVRLTMNAYAYRRRTVTMCSAEDRSDPDPRALTRATPSASAGPR